MFCAGFHDINSCRLDAGMTEQVRQFRDIFFEVVKCPRKQVPQVVEENFLPGHISALAQGFEQFPDRYAAQRLANTGKKHRTGMNAVFLAPAGQPVAEFGRQQNFPALALAANGCLMPADGFCRDKLQSRDADAGGAKRFQQQLGALVAGGACGDRHHRQRTDAGGAAGTRRCKGKGGLDDSLYLPQFERLRCLLR